MSCPAMPSRPRRPIGPLQLLRVGRDNSLAIWHQGAFVEFLLHRRLPGRDLWVLNNPGDLRRVLTEQPGNYTKSPETRRALRPLLGNSLLISEGEDWQRRRRIIAPVITGPERLSAYEPIMIGTIAEMLQRWDGLADGSALEMDWECTRLAAEVVSRCLFGFRLDGYTAGIYRAFGVYQDTLGRLDLMGLLGLPDRLPRPGEARARRAVQDMEQAVAAIIEATQGRGERRDDLPERLMEGIPGEPPLGPGQLRDEFMLALLAGHETTAAALCWAFYLLALHPEARAKLEAEADRELGPAGPLPGVPERLRYTRAVVNEALRLYPPIYQFTRQPMQPVRLGGQDLDPGSLLVISPWLLHRHKRFWKRPDDFVPERFLQAGGRRRRHCYIPFGSGPRVCPGAGFAMNELIYALAMTARRFRLDLEPGQRVEPLGRLTLRPRDGLPLRLSRR